MNVTEKIQPIEVCRNYVTELIHTRKEAKLSQQFMAEWLGVSRKKIVHFESGKFDFELFFLYCDKFDVEILIKIR